MTDRNLKKNVSIELSFAIAIYVITIIGSKMKFQPKLKIIHSQILFYCLLVYH